MRYFVTGTDTGIGKTVLSTVLSLGLHAKYWKPIQTGSIEGSDSDFLRRWLPHIQVLPELYSFPDPLSPHLASRNAGIEIHLEKCLQTFANLQGPIVVEGAGGVLAPINKDKLIIDLIKHLNLPVIIASSTRLGTINHSLLTVEALRTRSIPIAGIVTLGEFIPDTINSIKKYSSVPMIGHIPQCNTFHSDWFLKTFQSLQFSQQSEVLCQQL